MSATVLRVHAGRIQGGLCREFVVGARGLLDLEVIRVRGQGLTDTLSFKWGERVN